ncbi:MAG: hypothetical protein VX399_02435 [SAR324 cluster bacterium]|nr:hypothetical protein [SAR324 cluster bacterium]
MKPVNDLDEKGRVSGVEATGQRPLTDYIYKHEIVPLMTPSAAIRNCLRWLIFSTSDSSRI